MKSFKLSTLVKALLLTIPAYVLGLVVLAVYGWGFLFLWLIFMVYQQFEAAFLIGIPVACFVLGFVWYSLAKFIYSLLLKTFWSIPPQVLRPGGIRDGLRTCGEAFLTALPIAIVFAVLAGFDRLPEVSFNELIEQRYRYPIEKFLIQWFWLWLLSAIGYYHFARK
jgi:hypothetical protein